MAGLTTLVAFFASNEILGGEADRGEITGENKEGKDFEDKNDREARGLNGEVAPNRITVYPSLFT